MEWRSAKWLEGSGSDPWRALRETWINDRQFSDLNECTLVVCFFCHGVSSTRFKVLRVLVSRVALSAKCFRQHSSAFESSFFYTASRHAHVFVAFHLRLDRQVRRLGPVPGLHAARCLARPLVAEGRRSGGVPRQSEALCGPRGRLHAGHGS